MLIMQIAQGCPVGNQAKIVVISHEITNQQKNFSGNNFSRFTTQGIGASNGLQSVSNKMVQLENIFL